jgi:cell division protein FtsI (penicillin-binding protein 3)
MSMPDVMARSSNPAAAHMAMDVGARRQQEWLRRMGFFARVPVELPEAGFPIVPPLRNWGLSTVMTVAFGHGVAESPLAIVRGTAAAANGGVLVRPTLLARSSPEDDDITQVGGSLPLAAMGDAEADTDKEIVPQGPKLLSDHNSRLLRQMLRLVVTKGIGNAADVPGYFVGGKTGTAEKIGPRGGYLKHVNVAAFTGIFPMNAPRYAVYVMLDSPVGNKATHGWTTAGWVTAPAVAKIVARVAPMLGLFPNTATADAVEAELAIPLQPVPPAGARVLGPGHDPGEPRRLSPHQEAEHLRQDVSYRDMDAEAPDASR